MTFPEPPPDRLTVSVAGLRSWKPWSSRLKAPLAENVNDAVLSDPPHCMVESGGSPTQTSLPPAAT